MAASDPFDLETLRAPGIDLDALHRSPKQVPPRHGQGEAFLKGPIPWPWLRRAMVLPGKALHVALLLWKEAGCRRQRTVRFRLAETADLGISQDTTRRGLRSLEAAGLITILHHPGQALEVTLIEAPASIPPTPYPE
jgi:hypothetical protein